MRAESDHWERLQQLFHLADATPDDRLEEVLASARAGRFVESQKIANDMLDSLRQARIAPSHKYYGYARLLLAQCLAGRGEFREALPEAEAAYQNLSAFQSTPNGRYNSDRARRVRDDLLRKAAP